MKIEELKKQLENNTKQINSNFKKIEDNAQKILENLERIENNSNKIDGNAQKIQQNSYALDILRDYKNGNHRLFIALIVVIIMWFLTMGYLVYVLNDIEYEEIITETNEQEITDIDSIQNSYIINGDNYGKDKTKEN